MLLQKIKGGHAPYCRPELQNGECDDQPDILTLMKQCWAEDPAERPSFDDIAKTLRTFNKGKSVVVVVVVAVAVVLVVLTTSPFPGLNNCMCSNK